MNRRDFIRHLGIGIAAGASVPFIPSLIPDLIGGPTSGYEVWTEGVGSSPLTARDFSAMLNAYLPNKLLQQELFKRDYVLQKIAKPDKFNAVIPITYGGVFDRPTR